MKEVDNMDEINEFEYGYILKMIGYGYRKKYMIEGNERRGIEVEVMMREKKRDGKKIEVDEVKRNEKMKYSDLGIYKNEMEEIGIEKNESILKRD